MEFLRRAKEESESPNLTLLECNLRQGLPEFYYEKGPIAVDIETSGDRLLCVGFCQSDPIVYVVSADQFFEHKEEFQHVFDLFQLIFHNGLFDVSFLQRLGFTIPNWVDTMLLHHTIYSELPHSLAFVSSVYTRMPYWKWMAHEEEEIEDK